MIPLKTNHPETMPGEVFASNMNLRGFEDLQFVTKRRGSVAYDAWGKPIHEYEKYDFRPVFVQATELAEAGVLHGPKLRRRFQKG